MTKSIVVSYASVFYTPDYAYVYSWLKSQDIRLNGLFHGRAIYTGEYKKFVDLSCPGCDDLFLFKPNYRLDNFCAAMIFWGRFKILPDQDPMKIIEECLIYEEGCKRVHRINVDLEWFFRDVELPLHLRKKSLHWLIAQGLMEIILKERSFKHKGLVKFRENPSGLLTPSQY